VSKGKVDSILLINSYLTYCKKSNNPNTKVVQKYLTQVIDSSLNIKKVNQDRRGFGYLFLTLLSFLYLR